MGIFTASEKKIKFIMLLMIMVLCFFGGYALTSELAWRQAGDFYANEFNRNCIIPREGFEYRVPDWRDFDAGTIYNIS